MARIIRLTGKDGAIRELPFGSKVKLIPQLMDAKIEVVDVATGTVLPSVAIRVGSDDIVVSIVGNGKDRETAQDVRPAAGEAISPQAQPLQADVAQSERPTTASYSPATSAAEGTSGGLSGGTIALGALGLGALGGVAAAAGGGKSNSAPTVASAIPDQSSPEDRAFSYQVAATAFADGDGDVLTYSASLNDGAALPGWLSFDAGTRTFSGTPPLNFNGDLTIRVTASDGKLSVSDSFVLTVAAVNDAPTLAATIADQQGAENRAWSFQVPANTFSDVDGDTLTYSATLANGSALPAWLTFDAASRTFSGTPKNFAGQLSLNVTASDGKLSVSDTFDLTVEAAPVTLTNGLSVTARSGISEIFNLDASSSIAATISGFEAGDIIKISGRTPAQGITFLQESFADGTADMLAGSAIITLNNLGNDHFNNEKTFVEIYGTSAITYVI